MMRRLLERHREGSIVAWDASRRTTAAELSAHVAGFAALLPEPNPGDEIVVICRDRYRFTVALLAAWQRGLSVALPPNPQPETMRAMRERAGVRTVVHDVDGGLGIDVRDAAVVAAARAEVGRHPFAPFAALAPDRQLATVYTSGSTGEHTACPKTAAQIVGEASVLAETFALREGSRVLAMVPPHHIYGLLFGVLVPLVSGAALYRHTPLLAPEVKAVLDGGVDVLVTVPAHLRALCLAPDDQPRIERVFSSGAPLPPDVAREAKRRFGWTITEVFGSSETGGIAWRDSGGEGPWTPLPGVEVSAEDEALVVRSPFIHPDAPRPYVGADRIAMQPDGRFVHLGRADGVLKIGGVRVSLAEVERRLLAIEGVHDAAVMAAEVGGARGYEVWAAVVAPSLDSRAIRAALRAWLAPVAIPRRVVVVDALPREPNGKLPRSALEALFRRRRRA